ncbi:hypothetical protein [Arenibacter certesii]|uniref:Uncharacterized protein n=1 Tax=Arenibacter certesii TaxID=228955 RepID=A0A918J3M7_9FLAO|nr:hypothetical protein [Arenibacter certesii]GGW45568.1 hypothetical protein GCM10007383_32460 [Arenibacter certesii]
MFELGKLYIPTLLDFNPNTQKITFKIPEVYSREYIENIEHSLQIHMRGSDVFIIYYGEDDSNLSTTLDLEVPHIAYGNLDSESFGKIQERALHVLRNHIIDSQRELLNLFNDKNG